jgi:hypothetical protein
VNNDDIIYQLILQERTLCRLCVCWQSKVRGVPCEGSADDRWGPSNVDLQGAATSEVVGGSLEYAEAVVADGCEDLSENDSVSEIDVGIGENGDLLEEVENVAFADVYRAGSSSPDLWDMLHCL